MVSPVDIVIAGAQKSGTTSLLRYMAEHPALLGQGPVEIGYFYDREEWQAGWDRIYPRYFFAEPRGRQLVAKTAMLYARRLCVERLAEHNPDCRVVLLLRDPVARAFSSYRMERERSGGIEAPFACVLEVLDDRSHPWNRLFLQFGEYAAALRQLYEFFPREQVLVLVYEEFVEEPLDACRAAFRFVGVDDGFAPATDVAHNVGRRASSRTAAAAVGWLRRNDNPLKQAARRALPPHAFNRVGGAMLEATRGALTTGEPIDERVRIGLARYYAEPNRELEGLLGRALPHWTSVEA